jgi:hypothetical protein
MGIRPEWIAPCGLHCGVCGALYATRDNNRKFKERYRFPHCGHMLFRGAKGCKQCRSPVDLD